MLQAPRMSTQAFEVCKPSLVESAFISYDFLTANITDIRENNLSFFHFKPPHSRISCASSRSSFLCWATRSTPWAFQILWSL